MIVGELVAWVCVQTTHLTAVNGDGGNLHRCQKTEVCAADVGKNVGCEVNDWAVEEAVEEKESCPGTPLEAEADPMDSTEDGKKMAKRAA